MTDVSDDRQQGPLEEPAPPAPEPKPLRAAWQERLRLVLLRRNAAIVGIAVVVLAIGALVVWLALPKPDAVPHETTALKERIETLERRTQQLETQLRTVVPAQIPAELTERLATLESTVAAIRNGQASPAGAAAVAELRSRFDAAAAMLAELTRRVDALELRGGDAAGAPADTGVLVTLRQTISQLQQSFAELSARVDAVEKSAAGTSDDTALAEKIAALEKRMNEIEAKDVDTLTKRAATALAVANLVRATQGAGRFKAELGALAMIAPDDPALVRLRPYAELGLPTQAALAERFHQLIPHVIHAEDLAQDRWWLERMWTNFLSLVTIRRVGDQLGSDARAIVGRAERELADQDLPGAIQELRKLAPKPAEVARPWLEAAEARVALDRLVSDINDRLLAEIATED